MCFSMFLYCATVAPKPFLKFLYALLILFINVFFTLKMNYTLLLDLYSIRSLGFPTTLQPFVQSVNRQTSIEIKTQIMPDGKASSASKTHDPEDLWISQAAVHKTRKERKEKKNHHKFCKKKCFFFGFVCVFRKKYFALRQRIAVSFFKLFSCLCQNVCVLHN